MGTLLMVCVVIALLLRITDSTLVAEYVDTALQVAVLGLRARTIFAPGDPGHSPQVIQIADLRDVPGLTATFGRFNTLTASDGEEGVEYAGWQDLDPATSDITGIKKEVGTQITWEARKAAANQLQLWVKAGEELAAAMATKINVDVCATFASLSTTVGSTGVNITNANILAARNTLEVANAYGPHYVVLHSQQWYDLMTEANSPLVDASKTNMAEGFYGNYFYDDIYGMVWYITNDVQTANAGADRCGSMFNPEAFGLNWLKDFGLAVTWDDDTYAWKLKMTGYWGTGVVTDEAGVKLVTDA
jgi:hypothetical protein